MPLRARLLAGGKAIRGEKPQHADHRIVEVGPEAGDVTADEVAVQRFQPLFVEADACADSRPKVLDKHIAAGDQLSQHLPAFFVPQLSVRDRLLRSNPAKYQLRPSRITPCRRTGSPSLDVRRNALDPEYRPCLLLPAHQAISMPYFERVCCIVKNYDHE